MRTAAGFRLEGVCVAFGPLRALEKVDLTVDPGEAVALVGPSGAGKTTLLRLLNGSLRPTSGRVVVAGEVLSALPAGELRRLRAAIALVHQDLRLVPELRVVKNVLAGRLGRWSLARSMRVMLLPPWELVAEVHEILERVGIPDKLYQRTDRLSGGQCQRVAVARALFQEPRALLADEPVSSVDPARARDTVALLVEVCRERRLTLCVSLHNLELAREHFPRLVGLRGGRVAFDLPAAQVGEEDLATLYELGPEEAGSPAVARPGLPALAQPGYGV